jgi:hypothetical protein
MLRLANFYLERKKAITNDYKSMTVFDKNQRKQT